jgi:hypothetical protein
MAKILGLADIAVDGTVVLSGDDSTLEPGGVTREVVKGNQVNGYKEAVMESKLEVNVAIDASFSLDFYRGITNSTITFTADTGQVWSIAGAWCSTPPSIAQKDGKAKIEFTGPPATEQLA